MTSKASNPKDGIVSTKWRQYCVFPVRVIWEVGIAHLVGALKYGRTNWRAAGVVASVYRDASMGHIDQFWEGEDLDPESRAHHLAHAIAGLNILLDSILRNDWVDDRPPKTTDLDKVREDTQTKVDRLFKMFPNPVPPVTALNVGDDLPEWNGGSEFNVTIKGNKGTYDSHAEWVKAEPIEAGARVAWVDGKKVIDWGENPRGCASMINPSGFPGP